MILSLVGYLTVYWQNLGCRTPGMQWASVAGSVSFGQGWCLDYHTFDSMTVGVRTAGLSSNRYPGFGYDRVLFTK